MKFLVISFFLTLLLLLETYGAPLDSDFQSVKPDNFPDESEVVSSRKVIKTAENGQDYEYEYLYYYDDAENDTVANSRDDLLLDLTKQEKSSNGPREDLQTIAEAAAFSETSHLGIQMKKEDSIPEEVHRVAGIPSITPAVTTTTAPLTTTPKPQILEGPSENTEIRKTRPSSNNNRVRPKTTSTSSSSKTAVPAKESENEATTRKPPSRGKNRFSMSTTERTIVESSNERQNADKPQSTRTTSSPKRRVNSATSGRQPESSTTAAVREPSIKRKNEKKTSSQVPATEAAPVLSKVAEDSVRLQPVQATEVQVPTVVSLQKSSFDFEAEIRALDAEEDLLSKTSTSVPEVPVATISLLGRDVLTGQDEAAAHEVEMNAKIPELQVTPDVVEPIRAAAESTTTAAVNEDGRSTEPSLAPEELKVELAQSMDNLQQVVLSTEAETTSSPAVLPVPGPERTSDTEAQKVSIAAEISAPQSVQEPQQALTSKEVETREESKASQLGGRTNRLGQQRARTGEAARVTGGRRSTKASASEETTTTTTPTTTAKSTRSLFNNRSRVGTSRLGQSKQTSKTDETAANSVTEATTTTTTTAKVATRRPFAPLRRTSTTTTEQPNQETKTAEPVPGVEVATSTTAASSPVVRGKQRFSVHRGFRVTDGVNSDSSTKPESVSTSTTQAPVETSTAVTKPSKTAPRTRPSILLRSRTTTTTAAAPLDVVDRVDIAPETAESESVQDEPKQATPPKKPSKTLLKPEVSTEAPVITTAHTHRLNLLKNRPALVVSERPKTARNEVNLADRKNRFSTFLKKSANQTEEVKTQADNAKEEAAQAKSPEPVAAAQEAVEEPKTVEVAEVKPLPIQNRLRGNRRPGQISTTRRGAETQPSN